MTSVLNELSSLNKNVVQDDVDAPIKMQRTLGGGMAPASAAKYPAAELRKRLGMSANKKSRTRFGKSTNEMSSRRRSEFVSVASPIIENVLKTLTPEWQSALGMLTRNIYLHERMKMRRKMQIRDRTILQALLQTDMVKKTVRAYNNIKGTCDNDPNHVNHHSPTSL
jgi:hypothetical protein